MAVRRTRTRARLRRERQASRRKLITRTARIWTRLYKETVPYLKEQTKHWLRKLEKYSEDEVSSGLVINPPEISPKFTERLTKTLREAYAYGYWLNHLYVQELKNAQAGRSYQGKVKLSEMASDEELSRLLREFIRFDESEEWQEVIPQEAIEWLENYVPSLAGNLSKSVLERVNEVIRKSMLEGRPLKERMKALREVSPELSRMTEARIESIARTEITRADTMGRLTSMKSNPDVLGVEFSAILDDRTTEICSSRHGLVMTLDDPRLPENTPPCHVNCRSMLLSCTIYDYPDGLVTSHEFDEVPAGMQRSEDIAEVQKILAQARETSLYEKEAITIPIAKTITEANMIAVEYGIARSADFSGLDISVANELFKAVNDTKEILPEFGVLDFAGSAEQLFEFHCRKEFEILCATCPNLDTDDLRIQARVNIASEFPREAEQWGVSSNVSSNRGIGFFEEILSPEKINSSLVRLQQDVLHGYTPIGCGTLKSVVDHEIGHHIDYMLDAREDKKILDIWDNMSKIEIKRGLSEYGSDNVPEFIAEAWSEYRNNPTPRKISQQVTNRLMELWGVRFRR